ncbi:MAG: Ig-like domain-containing protein [Candidatus Levybacteria bacterium]|nr:Ig-like domain-containing protein [Candidatus Levybacteria bacterium]
MRGGVLDKKIPTLLGLILIILGIGLTSFLVKSGIITTGRATPTSNPQNLKITNVFDTSFTVSYITQTSDTGYISYGKDEKTGSTVLDDRDQLLGKTNFYKVHYITVKNLQANTKYFFTILSGKDTFLNNNKPFDITTASPLGSKVSSQKTLSGKVILLDGNVPKESIVFVNGTNTNILSTLVKNDGTYTLDLDLLRSTDLNSYLTLSENDVIQIKIIGDSGESNVKILAKQANSIPTIILSKDYDFTIENSIETQYKNIASESAESGLPTSSSKISYNGNPQILIPKKDEMFTDQQPLFKGTALPKSAVIITIHSSQNIQEQVITDSRGNWTYRPNIALSPGQHTITITTRDEFGMLRTINQSFNVYALGSQVTESATPSATPAITTSPSPTRIPTIPPSQTITPTIIPTSIPNPTSIPTPTSVVIVTSTPIPTPTSISTTSIPTPTTQIGKGGQTKPPGNSSLLITSIIGITATVIGVLLFLLTKGNASL